MALGGKPSSSSAGAAATMASTMLQIATSSMLEQSPSPTASVVDDGGDDSGGGGQRGANYFFGFLITFVVLLLVFVGCGVGSRRRAMARRELDVDEVFQAWGPPGVDGQPQRPTFFEETMVSPLGSDWKQLQPISVTLLREEKEELTEKSGLDTDSHRDSHEQSTTLYPSTNLLSVPSWIPRRRSRIPTDPKPSLDDPGPPESIQVAVMIVMPCRPDDRPSIYERQGKTGDDVVAPFTEYQIGLKTLPWRNS